MKWHNAVLAIEKMVQKLGGRWLRGSNFREILKKILRNFGRYKC